MRQALPSLSHNLSNWRTLEILSPGADIAGKHKQS